MKTAFVFGEGPDGSGNYRKTVVVREKVIDPVTQEDIETISTFIIIVDDGGYLQDAYEVEMEVIIPEGEFTDNHTVPVPAPDDKTVQLDLDDPENSQ